MADRRWHDRAFDELTTAELYAILALRQRVFVVEQNCVYVDTDGADLTARHLWLTDSDAEIVAYLRILPAGVKHAEVSIGRVIVEPAIRGTGLGRELMVRGIAAARAHHGAVAIHISAQSHLDRFYASLGFAPISEPYLDFGIPHVDMLYAAASAGT